MFDWKSTPSFPRRWESRLFILKPKTNLDAGFRRHDELSLRLKGGISSIPERDIKMPFDKLVTDNKTACRERKMFLKAIFLFLSPALATRFRFVL